MKKTLLILFFSTTLLAQEISLFKNDFQKSAFNEILKVESTKEFNEIIKISPELLFYYFNYLKNRYELGIRELNKNGFSEYRIVKTDYLERFNDWLNFNVGIQNTYNPISYKSFKFNAIINDYIDYSFIYSGKVKVKLDTNKMNYYSYKLFSKNEELTYNKNNNYEELLNVELDKIKKEMIYVNEEDPSVSNFQLFKKYHFLFSHSPLGNNKLDFSIFEFYKNCYKNLFEETFAIRVGYLYGVSGHEFASSKNILIKREPFDFEHEISFEKRIKAILEVDLKIRLLKEKGFFSFIGFQFGYLLDSKDENNKYKNLNNSFERILNADFERTQSNVIDELSNYDLKHFRASVSFPLIYLNDNFYIGGGVLFESIETKSKVRWDYYYMLDDLQGNIIVNEDKGEEEFIYKEKTTKPYIIVGWELLKYFHLKVNYIPAKSVDLGIATQFSF